MFIGRLTGRGRPRVKSGFFISDKDGGFHVLDAIMHYALSFALFFTAVTSLMAANGLHHRLTGEASYYADKFVGKPTASGQPYSHEKLTAAHRTFPFGTKLRVTNTKNEKSIEVCVNDRGPFANPHKRIIDLSKSAAEAIDMVKAGLASVTLEVIGDNCEGLND